MNRWLTYLLNDLHVLSGVGHDINCDRDRLDEGIQEAFV